MKAWITNEFFSDTNPLGRRVTLHFEADSGEKFRFEFDWGTFVRWDTLRRAIIRQLAEEFEDWMLRLPGDVTAIEKEWKGLVAQAFEMKR